MIHGVLFDFNGTLFQDSPKHKVAWTRYAKQRFDREFGSDADMRAVFGLNNRSTLEYLAGHPLGDAEANEMSREKEQIYRDLCFADPEHLHLTAGAEKLLDELKSRGLPLALATASIPENIDFYYETFGIGRWFLRDNVVFDNGAIPGKPQPDYYLLAAARIGVPSGECLVFEDSVSGAQAADASCAAVTVVVGPVGDRQVFWRLKSVRQVVDDFNGFDRALLDE